MLPLQSSADRKKRMRYQRLKALERHFVFLNSLALDQHWLIDYMIYLLLVFVHFLLISALIDTAVHSVRESGFYLRLFILCQTVLPVTLTAIAIRMYYQDLNQLSGNLHKSKTRKGPNFLSKVYMLIYRVSALCLEPLVTGTWIRMVIAQFTGDFNMQLLSPLPRYLFVVLVVVFAGQSIAYVKYAENILPRRNSIMACSSSFNVAMINLSIKVGVASDPILTHLNKTKANLGWLLLVMVVRCLPYLFSIYHNLKSVHFFHRFGAHSLLSLQIMYVVACCIYLITLVTNPEDVLEFIIKVSLIFAPMIVRLVINVYEDQHSFVDPNNCSLSAILRIAHSLSAGSSFLSTKFETVTIERKVHSAFYLDNPAFASFLKVYDKTSSSEEIRVIQFILYLFDSYSKRLPQFAAKALIYKAYFLTQLNLNFFQLSRVMGNLESIRKTRQHAILVGMIKKVISNHLEGIYSGRLTFLRSEKHFYSHKVSNSGGANEVKFSKFYNELDLQAYFGLLETYRQLHSSMTASISEIHRFYDKIFTSILQRNNVHNIFKRIFNLKIKASRRFQDLEQISAGLKLRPAFYLLPYALYQEALSLDKKSLGEIIRRYNERVKLISKSLTHNRYDASIRMIKLDKSICIRVASGQKNLGNIDYVSKNSITVFKIAADKLVNTNLAEFFTDEFRPLHALMMNSLMKQHNVDYLGQQRTRYARIGPEDLFVNVRTVVKLSPVLQTDIKFLCLIEKAEHDSCFAVVSNSGTLVGYNKTLIEKLPILQRFKGESLHLFSQELNSKYKHLLQKTLQSFNSDGDDNLNIGEMCLPPNLPARLRDSPNNKSDNWKELTIKIPYCREEIDNFSSFANLLETTTVFVSISPMLIETPSGKFIESKLNMSVEISRTSKTGPYNSIESQISAGVLVNQPLSKENLIDIVKELEKVRENKPLEDESMQVYHKSRSEPQGSFYNSTMGRISQSNKKKHKKSHQGRNSNTPGKVRKDFFKDLQDCSNPSIDIGRRASSIEYLNLKTRLYSTISRKNSTYILKELLCIIGIQFVIWALCRVASELMTYSYDDELAIRISLRQGIPFVGIGNAYIFTSIISTFDIMLIRNGLLPVQKFSSFMPKYNYQPNVTSYLDYRDAALMYHRLWATVYSIPYEYSQRYFVNKRDYRLMFSDGLQTPENSTGYVEQINTRALFREGLTAWSRWRSRAENATFRDPALKTTMDVYGPRLFDTVLSPTIVSLLVLDYVRYEELTSTTRIVVTTIIAINLIAANAILLIVLMIRNKIMFIYSGFERLYSFEIDFKKSVLKKLQTAMDKAIVSQKLFEKDFFYVLHENREGYDFMNSRKETPYLRDKEKSHSSRGCFGLLYFVLGLFALIVIYAVASLVILTDIQKETQFKIKLLDLQRGFISGSAIVHMIVMRDYVAVLNKHGSMEYPTYQEILKTNLQWRQNFTELLSGIDSFVNTKQALNPDTAVGFDTFLQGPACGLVDIAKFNMTSSECEALADSNMGKTPIEVLRWISFALKRLEESVSSLTPDTALDLLTNKMYLELQFLRAALLIPLGKKFTEHFQKKIFEYHSKSIFLLSTVLNAYFWLSLTVAIGLNVLAWIHLRRQVRVGLSSLLLFPIQSFVWNPAIASLLWKLN